MKITNARNYFSPDEVTNFFRRQPETHWHMKAIEAWLPKDYSVGTLAMNWTITLNVFAEGKVSVWEDAASGQPVAYCWGGLNSHDSVLEVQPEYRGLGVGRAMATFMIENSIAERDPRKRSRCGGSTSTAKVVQVRAQRILRKHLLPDPWR